MNNHNICRGCVLPIFLRLRGYTKDQILAACIECRDPKTNPHKRGNAKK